MKMIPFPHSSVGLSGGRARVRDVWLFTERLRHLMSSGVPEAEAVAVILNNLREGRFSRWLRRGLTNLGLKTPARLFWRFPRVLQRVLARLENGNSLSQALRRFPRYFPAAYVAIVRAGEQSGDLPATMKVAGDSLRRADVRIDRVVLGIMIPVIAVGLAYVHLTFLGRYVWPKFVEIGWGFEESGFSAGPLLTGVMYRFLNIYTVVLVATLLLFGAFFLYPAFKSRMLYRFCLLVNTVLRANLPIQECQRLSGRLSSGSSYQVAVDDLFRQMAQGKDWATAMASIRYFPQELRWIVTSGQFREDVPGAFSTAAEVLSNKADLKLARMLDVGPPLLTILTAIPVGVLGFSVFSFFAGIAESML